MPTHIINFSAALAAGMLALCACSTNGSTTRADSSPAAATTATPASAQATASDPIVEAADHGRVQGDANAKTWVIIGSDFQCPFCRQWHAETYATFIKEYVRTGKVKVAYVNYPLNQHQNAVIAAEGAMCAAAQNKFWQYHDGLFQSQGTWETMQEPRPVLDSLAKSVGVDMASWSSCVDSKKMLPLIRADRDRLNVAGVQSTPSFIIGETLLAGAQPIEAMRAVLDSVVARNSAAH
ncbi:MAG TPA: thioredoxin domain-containing protein [Gemmatimonadaceae bacterium]|nr:thioredoxin domain-containing protein [Gemmatimonadaceae bacterium]